ncbi:MAG: HAMP domain-containing sensor histidine kinase, partial [Syntrophomonadaceae bacterium]|nr:HAMP domain-containing sensor histidine kinase [Syntrophomonadaceae bacterium]
YFDIMLEELDRANSIISEFLSLAKNKIVDRKLKNLNSIIYAISPLLQADALLAEKLIELDLKEIPPLLLDEKEIRQLIINLVRNGLEAINSGKKVNISTYREGDKVILAIKDQGEGIDSGIIEKLGTPFFTTKEDGTGLGLAICYSIARRHDATIRVKSNRAGSTFLVEFKMEND